MKDVDRIFLLVSCIFSFFLLSSEVRANVSYDGDQVWRIYTAENSENVNLEQLLRSYGFDIWAVRPNSVDFRVPSKLVPKILSLWNEKKIKMDVIVDDVGKLIANQRTPKKGDEKADFALDEYHTLDEIFAFLDETESSNDFVTSEVIGSTAEGIDIRLMKVSTTSSSEKPSLWFDCGIHAREWISPATCLWGLNYLTSQYGVDSTVTNLLDNYDVYILPVLNADGYNYTWNEDRLWRKNRVTYPGESCVGVDLNRNYDDGHWGGIGASDSPCINTYHGPSPFSEFETSAVRDKISSLQDQATVKAFFSIHSYGQLWLFAFGWTNDLPAESDELYRVSQTGVDAIADYSGSVYTNGPHFSTIYPATGVSVDWGYSIGIVNSYIVELRDTGEYGFLLPEDQIIPTATEAWTGLIAAINEM